MPSAAEIASHCATFSGHRAINGTYLRRLSGRRTSARHAVILPSPPNIGLQPTAARCDAEPPRLKPGVRRLRVDRSRAASKQRSALMMKTRKVIVHIATSADGYVARPDGDLEWLTSRPAPKGFYGMNAFTKSIDTKALGRKTYEVSVRLGAKFDSKERRIVFSRHARPVGPHRAPSS
jgi:hypothetical protein